MFEWIYSIHPAWYVAIILYVLGTEVTYSLGEALSENDPDDEETKAVATAIMTVIWPLVTLIIVVFRKQKPKKGK